MKRFFVCALAITADLVAIASVFIGCSKSDPDPQELRWHGADSNYESTTVVHPRGHIASGNNHHGSEK